MSLDAHADSRLRALLAAAGDRDAKLWALLELCDDTLALPAAARVAGERVELTHVDYGGDDAQGLTAQVRRADGDVSVPLTEVTLLQREAGAELVEAYRTWFLGRGVDVLGSAAASQSAPDDRLDLFVLAVQPRTARCRRVDDGSDLVFRPSDRERLVPGTRITVAPRFVGARLEGPVVAVTIDAAGLGLVPPALIEEASGDFRLDLPEPPEALEDAALLAEGGDAAGARALLLALLAEDLRHLEAHATLGDLELDGSPQLALAHYAVGAALGDLTVPAELSGALSGHVPANRAYLLCLLGCARALHRLGREAEALAPLERLLALDPDDVLGATALLVALGGTPPTSL